MHDLVLEELYQLALKLGWTFAPVKDERGVVIGICMGNDAVIDMLLGED